MVPSPLLTACSLTTRPPVALACSSPLLTPLYRCSCRYSLHSDQVKISTIEHSCACSAFCAALGHASIALSIARCISVSTAMCIQLRCTSPAHVPVSYRIIPSIGQATSNLEVPPISPRYRSPCNAKGPAIADRALRVPPRQSSLRSQVSVYRLPRDAEHLCKINLLLTGCGTSA